MRFEILDVLVSNLFVGGSDSIIVDSTQADSTQITCWMGSHPCPSSGFFKKVVDWLL